jgi:hypothetical protein
MAPIRDSHMFQLHKLWDWIALTDLTLPHILCLIFCDDRELFVLLIFGGIGDCLTLNKLSFHNVNYFP